MTTRRLKSPAAVGLLLIGIVLILWVGSLVFRQIKQGSASKQQFLAIKGKAEQGDLQAQANLGDQYFFGEGTAKDRAEALKWWHKAAEQGDPQSQFSLAYCYYQGMGVEKDVAQALKWYQSVTNQGFNISVVAARMNNAFEQDSKLSSPALPATSPGQRSP